MPRFRLNQPHVCEYWPTRIMVRLDTDTEIDSGEMPPYWRPTVMMTPLDPQAEVMWRAELDRLRAVNRSGPLPVVGPLHHLPGGDVYEAIERRRREEIGR
jgi:hypothetical protein